MSWLVLLTICRLLLVVDNWSAAHLAAQALRLCNGEGSQLATRRQVGYLMFLQQISALMATCNAAAAPDGGLKAAALEVTVKVLSLATHAALH